MAMKEHPILFSTEMVQAILEGRKTQTRRIFKGTTEHREPYNPAYLERWRSNDGWKQICPYGQVGDRLWVRETFKHFANKWDGTNWQSCITYKAGNLTVYDSWDYEPPREKWWNKSTILDHWQPSIFMPRWASRITLEITDIRVERLQEITEEDAVAEGIMPEQHPFDAPPAMRYATLWDSINGKKHSWESNSWVWVIEFKKI